MADCRTKACCQVSNKILGDLSGFSLVGGDFPGGSINGNEESSFIVECPEGISCEPGTYPKTVIIDKNTNIAPYDPPPDDGPIVLVVPCGDGTEITQTFPAGTSQTDLNAAYYQMFRQCGESMAKQRANAATVATLYSNSEIGVSCNGLAFSAAPGGMILWDDANKVATLPGGGFTSYTNQAAADALATDYISTQVAAALNNGVQCGYWNTEQTFECEFGGDTFVTAAYTIFSIVSQADADQQALDAAEAECPTACNATMEALNWTPSIAGIGTGGGLGPYAWGTHEGTGTTNVVSDTFSSGGGYNCTLTVNWTITGGSSRIQVKLPIGGTIFDTGITSSSGSSNTSVFISSSGSQNMQLIISGGPGLSVTANMFMGSV